MVIAAETETPYVALADAKRKLELKANVAETCAVSVLPVETLCVIVEGPATNAVSYPVGISTCALLVAVVLMIVPAAGVQLTTSGTTPELGAVPSANDGDAKPRARRDVATTASPACLIDRCLNETFMIPL